MSAGHRASRRVGADGRLVFAPTRVRVGPFGGIDERRQIARRLAVACPRVDFGVGPTDSRPRGARERPGAARCQRDIVLGGLRRRRRPRMQGSRTSRRKVPRSTYSRTYVVHL